MANLGLSYNTRKALCVQLGDDAGNEIAQLLMNLGQRIESLERNKVDVTPIVPVAAALASATSQAVDQTV